MNAGADEPGITDADRERFAAFGDSGRPDDLLPDGKQTSPPPISASAEPPASTEGLAERLRERLAVGEVLVTTSVGLEVRRSARSLGRSLRALSDRDPPGLVVDRDGHDGRHVRWRIERVDARSDRR